MTDTLMPLIKQFLPYAQEKMGFKDPPTLFLRSDAQNAVNPLGKTAFYDPAAKSITLYITNRHPKDVMRSFSHELVHHTQNCNGEFNNVGEMGDGYAQNDDHLRETERQAYEIGNLCFRDWEDSIKNTIYFERLQKGAKKMSLKDWKNKELTSLLSEAWGFKFNTLQEFDEFNGTGEVQEEAVEEPESENLEEAEEEEEVQEASNPRSGNEDRQRPGRNPADRMHEQEEEEDLEEGEKKPDGDGDGVPPWADKDDSDPEVQEENLEEEKEEKPELSEEQLNALVKEAVKRALTTLQKG